jgi:hypothetical protein
MEAQARKNSRLAVEALMKNETETLQSQAAAATENDNLIASLKDDIVTLKEDVQRLQALAMTQHVAAAAANTAAAAICRWMAAPLGQVHLSPNIATDYLKSQCRFLFSTRLRRGFSSSWRRYTHASSFWMGTGGAAG